MKIQIFKGDKVTFVADGIDSLDWANPDVSDLIIEKKQIESIHRVTSEPRVIPASPPEPRKYLVPFNEAGEVNPGDELLNVDRKLYYIGPDISNDEYVVVSKINNHILNDNLLVVLKRKLEVFRYE